MPLTLTLDDDDAGLLAIALGFATAMAEAKTELPGLYPQLVALTNRIYASDPGFIPYKIPTNRLPSITCPSCRRTSFNPDDIKHAYCGYCHAFHAVMTERGLDDA